MKGIGKALFVSGVTALVGTTGVMAEDRLMGHTRSAVEAALPDLPADQLDLLVYRIPTIHQLLSELEPVSADTINPYELLEFTRTELEERFPTLSDAELDRLLFRIADINSQRTLERN